MSVIALRETPHSVPFPVAIAAPDRPAIEAEGLVKSYASVQAVDGVSLAVRRGEVFGFLGPNGAGKTTTIGMILGVISPTSGRVRLFGRELRGNERELLARVGALVEVPTFYPYLSARDNLRVLARLDGTITANRIEDVLRLTQLLTAADRPFKTYSLGMKQRLGIAAALLGRPEAVILDEPTNGLDPQGIVEIRRLLRDLASEGRAVLLSSHQLNEVQQICDRVAIVNHGKIVVEGAVADLLREQRHLRVTVSDADLGLRVARSLRWVTRAEVVAGAIAIFGDPPHPFALSQALAASGVWLGQLVRPEASLEQLFLRITTEASPFPASNGSAYRNSISANGKIAYDR
jgi:ABC-2 type transport system ATP-binding protein